MVWNLDQLSMTIVYDLAFSLYHLMCVPILCSAFIHLLFLCCVRWNRRLNERRAMAAEAITEVLEDILLVVVANGGQHYKALQNLELELT